MFRPLPERTLFGYLPVRLIVSILILFALLFSVGLVVSLELEKQAIEQLIQKRGPDQAVLHLPFLTARWDVLKVVLILLLLGAVGVGVIATYQNYRAATRSFEQVKSLTRDILQSIPTGVVTSDLAGRITSVNTAAERLLGKGPATLLGQPVVDAFGHGELARLAEERAGSQTPAEIEVVHSPEGDRRFTLRVSVSELRDGRGQHSGLVFLLRDITDMMRLERELRRADKLAAIGTLAAGVAHEIKNPLSALTLNLHLLEEEIRARGAARAEAAEYFRILNSEARRLQRIVDNFLRFSKPAVPEFRAVDVNAILEHVLSLVSHEAQNRGVAVETKLHMELPTAWGDETQLSQVFLNLVINALQAMPEGGKLAVRTMPVNGIVEIHVADTGEGIPSEHLLRLFDPFFTTRPDGMGLGLAIAHRIIEGHRGTIDVESAVGRGTQMIVRLPLDSSGLGTSAR